MAANRAVVVGLLPGGSSCVSADARRCVEEAEVLAGGQRQLAAFAEHPGERIVIRSDATRSVQAIGAALEAGKRVAVLASGDPLLFGIGATLVRELGADRVRVLPAASSVQMAFARLGEPWHDATILSAHGRALAAVIPAALAASKVAFLTDSESTPAAIATALMSAGMADCRAVVCERLSEPNEHVIETRLVELPGQEFDPLNVLLLFRQPEEVRLRFGDSDQEFESVRSQITKAEVRAVTLSKLRLPPHGVLWDVGAGSGALAIEAARLMPRGTVYAVERDPEQRGCLERNVGRHAAANVQVVAGEAPEALAELPAAQAVFLGGSGGRLPELLAELPRPFVANFALIEHVSLALERFPSAEVVQINVSRGDEIGGGHRLQAMNPVYIVSVPG